jgi:RHS repeat-associated protein
LPAPPASSTEYVTVDDVGTTRLVTGTLGNVLERHDFEPFGHELMGTEGGWRTSVPGYGVTPTSVRQQFTGQERDDTGLDFFQARYFTSAQGRFASVDPANAGASLGDPQSWNAYAYVSNSPLRFTDPSGMDDGEGGGGLGGFGGIGVPLGGGSSTPSTMPGPSTGSLDAQNPLLQGFNPCGGPSGTFGGGATGCPFVFSATGNGASPVWVSGDLVPTDLGTLWDALKYISDRLNPPHKLVIIHMSDGRTVNVGEMQYGVIPVGPPEELVGQIHHIATNKNFAGGFTAAFERLFGRAGMTLNDDENLVRLAGHTGPHAPEYHQMVLDRLVAVTKGLQGGGVQRRSDPGTPTHSPGAIERHYYSEEAINEMVLGRGLQ